MKKFSLSIYSFLLLFGVDLIKSFRTLKNLGWYFSSFLKFKKASAGKGSFNRFTLFPCLEDREDSSGSARGHYFHQDLYIAQKIFERSPKRHVDVGSRIDGFVAHVASFRPIEVFDIRPLNSEIHNVTFRKVDFTEPSETYRSCADSVSCLHALEHFGLGRYGDPLDVDGHIKGYNNLKSFVSEKGVLYLSVPIGPGRVEFNAHRVFDIAYLLELFGPDFKVFSFSYVDDRGDLHKEVTLCEAEVARNYGCHYGCGIFELIKA